MINAGLLVVLFVGALSRQDDVIIQDNSPISKLNGPLFSGESDYALQKTVEVPVHAEIPSSHGSVFIETPKMPEVETPVLHKLPPVAAASSSISEPQRTASTVSSQIAAAPSRSEDSLQEVVVKKGDSLDKIAKAHHTSVDEIIKLNQLPGSFLKAGQVLKIPGKKEGAVVARPVQEKASGSNVEYYTVKVGDNPWSIAMKHHMKVEELLKLNGLNEENARKLKPGNRLRIR